MAHASFRVLSVSFLFRLRARESLRPCGDDRFEAVVAFAILIFPHASGRQVRCFSSLLFSRLIHQKHDDNAIDIDISLLDGISDA